MKVAVIMGSDSDWQIMQECVRLLKDEFGIAVEAKVLSAHRTPQQLVSYIKKAEKEGVKLFIAAAGGSAALAGTIAAHTLLPVIGVPLDTSSLSGWDALCSTVQMPPGVPVACMAIGKWGAINAAIFAAQVLALKDAAFAKKLQAYRSRQQEKVLKSKLTL